MKTCIIFILLTIGVSCQSRTNQDETTQVEVSDWEPPCDLNSLCGRKEILSSLNGPIEYRQSLVSILNLSKESFQKYQLHYADYIYYICGKLISVGGCSYLSLEQADLSPEQIELYFIAMANCHHYKCYDYFQGSRHKFLKLANSSQSLKAKKSFYLMAIKLPRPWFEKSGDLRMYIHLLEKNGEKIEYKDLGALISAIPNHEVLKDFVARNFFKIDSHKSGVSVYLARYQEGWHDRNYKRFLNKNVKDEDISAFLLSMPIGCPKLKTILAFKDHFSQGNERVLKDILKQDELNTYFKELKLKENVDSKCLSSLPPAS
ncbi:hypothetical protein [Bacteriovorax sp. BAL6_X]|uniref:hypothetical protein n=1 Tax=Bacteriovorax sp. BAL6_X TaxID=1201290 RepID=UPI0012EE93D2|nr:hypothetical protein [Bacteriovorax sp. BAL6_X]